MSSPGMIRRVLFSEKGKRVVDIEEKSKIPINLDLSCCHMKNNAEMFSAIQKFVCAIYGQGKTLMELYSIFFIKSTKIKMK